MNNTVSLTLTRKLHPSRFPHMSNKMAAIVAYILDEQWTSPRITEMAITSDGQVLTAMDGEVGLNHIIGGAKDLDRNIEDLLDAAELSNEEKADWIVLYHIRVVDWRQSRTLDLDS